MNSSSGMLTTKELETIARRAIQEGRHVGLHDFPCTFAFDPKSIYLGEVNGQLATQVSVIPYPKHHYHIGGLIVTEKYRQKGYVLRSIYKAIDTCDKKYTIGTDMKLDKRSDGEMLGGKVLWNTNFATLNLERIVANVTKSAFLTGVAVKPTRNINLDKLLEYDQTVFGTPRQTFMMWWINVPGSLGWATVHEKSDTIVGYAVVKQVISGGEAKTSLAVAPLYADSVEIAKSLLKTAAENCLANEAVLKTKLEMFHPVGDNCGEGAAELMDELKADLTHIAYRMYNKGIPPG